VLDLLRVNVSVSLLRPKPLLLVIVRPICFGLNTKSLREVVADIVELWLSRIEDRLSTDAGGY
jgi:hypothetical protein